MFQGNAKPESPAEAGGSMLRSTMTCGRLREWVKLAQPNARLTYAEGSLLTLACTPEVKELVASLAGKGMLTPHFVRGRGGEPSRYIVQRSQRPYLKGMEL
jgi:hypothetical protein